MDVYVISATGNKIGNFTAWEWANKLMASGGVNVDTSDYRHSIFDYKGLKVENHRVCASAVKGQKRAKRLDAYMKQMIASEQELHYIGDSKLLCPPALFNVIFFIQHAYAHFIGGGITLRHICDWGMLIKAYSGNGEDFWNKALADLEEYGFGEFTATMTRLSYLATGVEAPWMKDYALQPQDEMLLQDCFDVSGKQVPFGNAFKTHLKLARNRIRGRWKYKYISDRPMLVDLVLSVWGVITDKEPD